MVHCGKGEWENEDERGRGTVTMHQETMKGSLIIEMTYLLNDLLSKKSS